MIVMFAWMAVKVLKYNSRTIAVTNQGKTKVTTLSMSQTKPCKIIDT